MMQMKAQEEPDDTMGSGAMGIATTEVRMVRMVRG